MIVAKLATLVALSSALIYGVFFLSRPPSLARTVFKTLPLGLLALVAYLLQAPWLLVGALLLSAVGDAALSRDTDRAFLLGLGVFLLAHIAYVVLFAASVQSWAPDLRQWLQLAALALLAAVFVRILWPHLGDMRVPVVFYMIAILSMGGLSVMLPGGLVLASVGALAFVSSDSVLAVETFMHRKNVATGQFVWWSYCLGQLLIAVSFVHGLKDL